MESDPAKSNASRTFPRPHRRRQYDATADVLVGTNHLHHNLHPEYWGVLLRPVVADPRRWRGRRALDVACGGGRNVLSTGAEKEKTTALRPVGGAGGASPCPSGTTGIPRVFNPSER